MEWILAYQSILALSDQMLASVEASDWEAAFASVAERQALFERLDALPFEPDTFSIETRETLKKLIIEIQEKDAVFIEKAAAWRATLEDEMGYVHSQRKLQQAYGF